MKYNAFYIQLLYKTKYIVNNVMCGVEDSFSVHIALLYWQLMPHQHIIDFLGKSL